jgi:nucleotidyltransferase/DNA polymerase involved in DNA repair
MISLPAVTKLHQDCVARWHEQPIDNPYEGILATVCEQLSYNYRLWHEEDKARSPTAGDTEIAQVKRAIDKLNQQRNDWIERLDDWFTEELARRGVAAAASAPQNTETLGSTIDRLAILALRIYHLIEQRDRPEATPEHRESVSRKLAIALAQHDDLSRAAQQLADDLAASRKRHKTYRQLKMYNDPALNPYLYRAQQPA